MTPAEMLAALDMFESLYWGEPKATGEICEAIAAELGTDPEETKDAVYTLRYGDELSTVARDNLKLALDKTEEM